MTASRSRVRLASLAVTATAVLTLAACSATGGRQVTQAAAGGAAGSAGTPRMSVALITHSPAGDTFWDIVRKGAEMAAKKDNVNLTYSGDQDPANQAQLVQAAIDKKVDGIAVTDPNTGALGASIKKAVAAGIPVVMLNAGESDAFSLGALGYFGQDESDAGLAVGQRIAKENGKNVLCIIQGQGQSQLEARCDGVAKGLAGAKLQRIYVSPTDVSDTTTKVQAKLTQDPSIDWVIGLGASYSLAAAKGVSDPSKVKVATFDTNKELVAAIKSGTIQFAVDQQPYLQGYLGVDALWLFKTNGNTIGGGKPTATGPSFVDKSNVDKVAAFANAGTR